MVDDGSRYFLRAAPMVTLSIVGGGCWRPEDGWPWLRIKGQHEGETSKGRVVLDRCLRSEGGWKKEIDVELQGHKDGAVSLELWVGASRFTDFLQFVRGWSVDLQQWVKSGAAKRWYEVKTVRPREQKIPSVANELEYFESEEELQSSAAYIFVGIVAIEEDAAVESLELPQPGSTMLKEETAKTSESNFRFILPYRSLTRSGKLRAVRVGQIVHEVCPF
ncbi:hypothetical protein PHYPSEUDO_004386 [Phytophthora pseudosyringae]|uniref:Uncharacterized protein n=1 Tax=Phytophthora pseudosyringae TaxID=221518 RepID=A0A8T1VRZ0_9STRA|nr:hypothetical protein PHYPSEUDO_004386 [Phytophthora pseudosyringae]